MFSDMLFTAVCPLKDLQRFVVFKIISIVVLSFFSFDYKKRITAIFEDFIKIFLNLKKDAIKVIVTGISLDSCLVLSYAVLVNISRQQLNISLQFNCFDVYDRLIIKYQSIAAATAKELSRNNF